MFKLVNALAQFAKLLKTRHFCTQACNLFLTLQYTSTRVRKIKQGLGSVAFVQKPIAVLLLSIISLNVQADASYHQEQTYIKPADFVSQQFSGSPPKAKVLWLNKPLKKAMANILQHRYDGFRVRYWQNQQQTVWILNEIGKEKDITVGITIKQQSIKVLKVLVFRESRGWEIKHDFFTNQFKQLFLTPNHQLNKTIDSISGATLSVRAVEKLAKIALLLNQHINK